VPSAVVDTLLQVAGRRQPWLKCSCKLQRAVSPGENVPASCREPFAFPVVDAIPVVDTIPVVDAIPVADATGSFRFSPPGLFAGCADLAMFFPRSLMRDCLCKTL
jgi:hypothetical protein